MGRSRKRSTHGNCDEHRCITCGNCSPPEEDAANCEYWGDCNRRNCHWIPRPAPEKPADQSEDFRDMVTQSTNWTMAHPIGKCIGGCHKRTAAVNDEGLCVDCWEKRRHCYMSPQSTQGQDVSKSGAEIDTYEQGLKTLNDNLHNDRDKAACFDAINRLAEKGGVEVVLWPNCVEIRDVSGETIATGATLFEAAGKLPGGEG